ncbi:MAG: GAF domain-containing protein, partial [Dehalococcoidia bacterium]
MTAQDPVNPGESGGGLSTRLARALNVAAAAAELRQRDHARLLDAIVTTAARVIEAEAGSLLLLDPKTDELVFQVATGPGADAVRQFRVSVGQGIAGFTASTGQALAIADTSQDPRFARQIAEGSGYVPKNLLCVPLLLRGELIGVMELLDKRGGNSPFTPQDMAILASFGEQAALAIDHSLHMQSLERLLIGAARGENDAQMAAEAAQLVAEVAADPTHDRTLGLARQVAALAGAG